MRATPTGSGRRESYQHMPMPRMTNTFMLSGQSDPEEIVKSVDKGLYCATFGGGQVDITSGNFVFSATRELPDREREADAAGARRDTDWQRSGGAQTREYGRQ